MEVQEGCPGIWSLVLRGCLGGGDTLSKQFLHNRNVGEGSEGLSVGPLIHWIRRTVAMWRRLRELER